MNKEYNNNENRMHSNPALSLIANCRLPIADEPFYRQQLKTKSKMGLMKKHAQINNYKSGIYPEFHLFLRLF